LEAGEDGGIAGTVIENELIVVLREYHSLQQRLAIITEALADLQQPMPPPSGYDSSNKINSSSIRGASNSNSPSAASTAWRVVPRTNAASQYPSDFEVVRVGRAGNATEGSTSALTAAATGMLLSSAHVRSVTPQRLVRRRPLAEDTAPGGRSQPSGARDEGTTPDLRHHLGNHRQRRLFKDDGTDRRKARNAAEALDAGSLWASGVTGKVCLCLPLLLLRILGC